MSQRTVISSIVVEAVRAACLEAALLAYEDAGAIRCLRRLCVGTSVAPGSNSPKTVVQRIEDL